MLSIKILKRIWEITVLTTYIPAVLYNIGDLSFKHHTLYLSSTTTVYYYYYYYY